MSKRSKAPAALLPDWTDKKQYPDLEKTSPTQWAWEFLRRNPEFQKQWNKTIAPWITKEGFDVRASIAAIRAKNGSTAITITSPLKLIQERFGYDAPILLTPSTPSDSPLLLGLTFNAAINVSYESPPKKYYPKDKIFEATVPLKPNESAVIFDLQLPIEPQIKAVRLRLNRMQDVLSKAEELDIESGGRRRHAERYQNYLRLLDGHAVGASYTKMAQILYQDKFHNLKVRDALKAAKILRDINYLVVARVM